MTRPRAVEITFWLMCATNALGLFYLNPSARHFAFRISLNAFLIAIGYAVLIPYRNGRNWARWLVLATSLLTLWNLRGLNRHFPGYNGLFRIMVVTEAPLGLFLLIYLNLPAVRAWFAPTAGEAQLSATE